MKKILSTVLAAIFILSLCACQGPKDETSSKTDPQGSSITEASSKTVGERGEDNAYQDKTLEFTAAGKELLDFIKSFSVIRVGYLPNTDDDSTSFENKQSFKNVEPLDVATFICKYLESKGKLWGQYQGKFDYEGYTVPAADLNTWANDLFGFEYDFSKIKETQGYGCTYKYIPDIKAFDVHIWGTVMPNGYYEYKGVEQSGDTECKAVFSLWEREEEKPDGIEGKDWKQEDGIYWEYDGDARLTVTKIDGKWRYTSFVEIND